MCEIAGMYAMRPLIDHGERLELPTCMYKMRNLHSVRNGEVINDTAGHVVVSKGNLDTFERVLQFLKKSENSLDMAGIIKQQENILRKLDLLKGQMMALRAILQTESSTEKISPVKIKTRSVKIESYSAVINLNPTRPPYFLEILQEVLKDTVKIEIIPHLHSSVSTWPVEIKNLLNRFEKRAKSSQNNLPTVTLRVILKDIDTQAQLSISNATVIGDVNILRYLARTVPVLRYEDANPTEIDPILDACYYVAESKTKTGRAKHIHFIFKKLNKAQWLCNEKNFTIADIAVYSTLKHLDENELNVTLSKYIQQCKSTFGC